MSELLLTLPTTAERNEVDQTLKEALERGFTEVIVMGYREGKVHVMTSKVSNTVELVGALEWAKWQLMDYPK